MAVEWGGYAGRMRVGIDIWTDGYDTWTPSIGVHIAVHVQCEPGWNFGDNQHVSLRGSAGGDWDFYNNLGSGQARHIGTVDIWGQGQSYGGGPDYNFTATLSGNYLGPQASHTRWFRLPARPTRPPAPPSHGPIFQVRDADRAYLRWGGTPDDGGAPLREDQLQVSLNPEFTAVVHHSFAPGSERWVPRLAPGTRYWARAAVRSDAGWSGWSAVTSDWTLPYKTGTPGIADIGPDSARVNWASPTDFAEVGGSTEVWIAQNPEFTIGVRTNYQHESAPRNTFVWTGLGPATRYYVRVRTGVRDGWGQFSDTTSFETLSGAKIMYQGQWRDAVAYVRQDGQWKQAKVFKRVNGAWVI